MADKTATLKLPDGKTLEFPVLPGSIGPDVVDIRTLYGKSGPMLPCSTGNSRVLPSGSFSVAVLSAIGFPERLPKRLAAVPQFAPIAGRSGRSGR